MSAAAVKQAHRSLNAHIKDYPSALSLRCQDSAEHSRLSVLPLPVGASSSAFCCAASALQHLVHEPQLRAIGCVRELHGVAGYLVRVHGVATRICLLGALQQLLVRQCEITSPLYLHSKDLCSDTVQSCHLAHSVKYVAIQLTAVR